MKFENLIYNGKEIRVIVDLEDFFIEINDEKTEDDCDTLDLSLITNEVEELEV